MIIQIAQFLPTTEMAHNRTTCPLLKLFPVIISFPSSLGITPKFFHDPQLQNRSTEKETRDIGTGSVTREEKTVTQNTGAGCNEFSVTLADRGVRISEMVCATHGCSSWWAWPRGRAGGCDMGGVVAV